MNPLVVSTIAEVRRTVTSAKARGASVGLVPTMGALHEGHVSLIRAARAETGFAVVSVFVNPTQFGPHEDYSRYPRPFEQDLELCGREDVDVIFAPTPATIYPEGYRTYVEVEGLQEALCGASRPGHFRGVCTIVLKLFNIVRPDVAYFGQKDAQQVLILRKMVQDLNVEVGVRVCATVREPDGLALSSRNQYLDADQRRRAVVLSQALREAKERVLAGERDAAAVQRRLAERIAATPGATLDYAAVVSAATLQPPEQLHGRVLLAVAVKFGATRLIDNVLLAVAETAAAEVNF